MSRIRTIKPEFFSSEDIASMSPLARLFYVSLWCEADREGRFDWKLGTFKLRYFAGDDVDLFELSKELIDRGLIVLYEAHGKQYAEIPTFKEHQVINNRESESTIPARVKVACTRVLGEGRKEGKGKEGKGKEDAQRVDDPESLQGFDAFWKTWPDSDRKQGRGKCFEVWKKSHVEKNYSIVLSHVEKLKDSDDWQKQGGQFIPAPLVYLNGRRWEGVDLSSRQSGVMAGAI